MSLLLTPLQILDCSDEHPENLIQLVRTPLKAKLSELSTSTERSLASPELTGLAHSEYLL